MGKVYAVTVEYQVMVYAENSDDAEQIARHELPEIARNEDPNVFAWNPDRSMERRWAKSVPYGDHQWRTVRDLLEQEPKP